MHEGRPEEVCLDTSEPASGLYLPAAQLLQPFLPVFSWYFPAGHIVQVADAWLLLYLPWTQSEQSLTLSC